MKPWLFALLLVLLAIGGRIDAVPASPQKDLSSAARVFAVFQKHCAACHGDTGFARSYLQLDRAAMVRTGKIVPGRSEESILYQRVTGRTEPLMPEGGPKLPDSDIAAIRQWIDDGAPEWTVSPAQSRRLISDDDLVSAIEKDLNTSGRETSRQFFRYFVLTHLYNSGNTNLTTYRAALVKLLNSLSWDKDIVLPAVIDPEETIVRIDLRDYGWTDPASTWDTILAGYPYGVELPGSGYARIQIQTSSDIPLIRADWFLAAASVPPLYHDILELPETEAELETCGNNVRRCLQIDTERNLRDSPGVRVVRAGFTESGVSNSNRIVERHRSPYGAYWKSHDFPDNIGDHNIFQHPLDFRRAGGEIIFNLPNGLQAYLLVNEKGERIDQAPTNIVFDKGGSRAEIRNGLSCMSCHANGMRSFTDDVRATLLSSSPFMQSYALALYPENDVMKKLVLEDEDRFRTAVQRAGVKPGTEPIAELTERYMKSVDSATAAWELGLTKNRFLSGLTASPTLQQLGLATLLTGGAVKRDAWEDVFGDVVQELGIGTYIAPTRVYGERFFSGSPLRPVVVGTTPGVDRTLNDLAPSIINGFLGRTVRLVENGRQRIYSVKDVRIFPDCSAEIVDANRFTDTADPRLWQSEEFNQRFSLKAVQASLTSSGNVGHVLVTALSPGVIRLERTAVPGTGPRTEFPQSVQFDLPLDAATDRAFDSLRRAIQHCSTRLN